MADVSGQVYSILIFVLGTVIGAVINILIKNFQQNLEWADTRKATYDLIANDLARIGNAGFTVMSEYRTNETHLRYPEKKGKYWYAAMVLDGAISDIAWMNFDECRECAHFRIMSQFEESYTETFFRMLLKISIM